MSRRQNRIHFVVLALSQQYLFERYSGTLCVWMVVERDMRSLRSSVAGCSIYPPSLYPVITTTIQGNPSPEREIPNLPGLRAE